MKTIAIVVGHGPKVDQGVTNHDGTTELAWNTDLAHRIKAAIAQAYADALVGFVGA
jgi:N-acetylmuramoyl-L-alanine amidase